MQMPPGVETRPIAELVPYDANARTHSDDQIAQIAASMAEFGWTNPVLIDGAGNVIAAHGRLLAAEALGLEDAPVIALEHLTDAQRRAYIIADNRLAENAGWDDDLLAAELARLEADGFNCELTGFSAEDMQALLARAEASDGITDADDCPEAEATAVSRDGDVWLSGRHRVACGDSTKAEDVARLLAGKLADIVVTSPPYNQSIDKFRPSGMFRNGSDSNWVNKVARLAYDDTMPEAEYQKHQAKLLDALFDAIKDGGSLFYNHKNRYRDKKVVSPLSWLPGPFSLRQEIIWRRPGSVTQNARMFLPSDERIYWLYRGDDFLFNDRTEVKSWSTVWDVAAEPNLDHAVAFPVEIPRRCLLAASLNNGVVYDPFLGSGTTMIAAEKEGRICYGMEISPNYADVAVKRWQAFTGQRARLDGADLTFEEVAAERSAQAA